MPCHAIYAIVTYTLAELMPLPHYCFLYITPFSFIITITIHAITLFSLSLFSYDYYAIISLLRLLLHYAINITFITLKTHIVASFAVIAIILRLLTSLHTLLLLSRHISRHIITLQTLPHYYYWSFRHITPRSLILAMANNITLLLKLSLHTMPTIRHLPLPLLHYIHYIAISHIVTSLPHHCLSFHYHYATGHYCHTHMAIQPAIIAIIKAILAITLRRHWVPAATPLHTLPPLLSLLLIERHYNTQHYALAHTKRLHYVIDVIDDTGFTILSSENMPRVYASQYMPEDGHYFHFTPFTNNRLSIQPLKAIDYAHHHASHAAIYHHWWATLALHT